MIRQFSTDINGLVGKPITYEGADVGHVVKVDGNIITGAIDSDIVNQLIRGNKVSFSLEVTHK